VLVAASALVATTGWSALAGAAEHPEPVRGHTVTLATPPAPSADQGHLLLLSPTTRRISAWDATDLTKLEATSAIASTVSVVEAPNGTTEVAGRTTTGSLDLFTSAPGSAKWSVSNVTTLAGAPTAVGNPSLVVDASDVTRIFYRTSDGHLDEVENDSHSTSEPWFGSDLTALTATTQSPTISGNPVAMAARGYPIVVYARASDGDLVGFTLTSLQLHPWYFENITALSLGPSIKGNPAVVPAPDGLGLTAIYALSPGGQLVEFTDDDAGFHLWSARDVTATADLPPIGSSPTAIAGDPTEVATATTAGHAIVVTVPSVTLAGATVQDVSGMARQRVLPAAPVSIARSGSGYVLAAESPARHVVVFDVATPSTKTATSSDATTQLLTEQLSGDAPVALHIDGSTEVFVSSGGFIGLVARIVLAAEAEDQYHASVVETPANSNCNPFTASFGRGTTAGCPAGTASEEWCSDFSDWVWTVAGISTTGIDGASKSFVTWGEARGQFLRGITATPAVGDAVVWGTLSPLWGAHVGIVVGVSKGEIDVVSGNSGGYGHNSGVWDSGYFLPASQSAQGDPIIGYVSPVPLAPSTTGS
jgi:hypothetical protein